MVNGYMKNKKITIIGHFGGSEDFFDGQTIKTKILYDELKKFTNWEIKKIDTYYKNKRPFYLFWSTIKSLVETRDVIILLSENGMKFFFPLLYLSTKIVRTKVYHDVIGGNLDLYINKYPKYLKYLNSFNCNWIETKGLAEKLKDKGVNNTKVMPNFKRIEVVDKVIRNRLNKYKFCIFSRIMKEKGIEDAIEAINIVNRKYNKDICSLDIYGHIDKNYEIDFYKIIDNSSIVINYKGIVPYEKSVSAIKDNYALLFPTRWSGEGFPGTIIDAFSAGLPVIATDWNCNKEIITDMYNGILYPSNSFNELSEVIEWSILHEEEMYAMRENCIESAVLFKPDRYIADIVSTILK